MIKSKGLGRGLSALIGENVLAEGGKVEGKYLVELNKIVANPNQPRVSFKEEEIESLAKSIEQKGVLQPLILREIEEGKYQIIAGERRWRAAKIAGLVSVPAIIRDAEDTEVFEVALIENIQRENLNPMEEAEAYKKLIEEYGYTQEKVAQIISKSRSHIANLLRLHNLPDKIKNALRNNEISLGHAKLLVNQDSSEEIIEQIINDKLSVRAAELLIAQKKKKNTNRSGSNASVRVASEEELENLESFISEAIGAEVKIQITKQNNYRLTINEFSIEQMDLIVAKLTSSIA
jgi:ParB family transcriptional regulator, chromosome partitioning protein